MIRPAEYVADQIFPAGGASEGPTRFDPGEPPPEPTTAVARFEVLTVPRPGIPAPEHEAA